MDFSPTHIDTPQWRARRTDLTPLFRLVAALGLAAALLAASPAVANGATWMSPDAMQGL